MVANYGWEFRTKLELAAAMVRWLIGRLGEDDPPVWGVTDEAHAKRPFVKAVLKLGVMVISWLRSDAALWSMPPEFPVGQCRRGRPRVHGTKRIDLAKRAG